MNLEAIAAELHQLGDYLETGGLEASRGNRLHELADELQGGDPFHATPFQPKSPTRAALVEMVGERRARALAAVSAAGLPLFCTRPIEVDAPDAEPHCGYSDCYLLHRRPCTRPRA